MVLPRSFITWSAKGKKCKEEKKERKKERKEERKKERKKGLVVWLRGRKISSREKRGIGGGNEIEICWREESLV